MPTADKVTELFCMANDFCKFFDKMLEKYTLKDGSKRAYTVPPLCLLCYSKRKRYAMR